MNCIDQPKLYNSLKKYGVENHTFEVIEECLIFDLNNRELHYQEFYMCVENGLNCVFIKKESFKEYKIRREKKEIIIKRKNVTDIIDSIIF
jgi:hypothetical protein